MVSVWNFGKVDNIKTPNTFFEAMMCAGQALDLCVGF